MKTIGDALTVSSPSLCCLHQQVAVSCISEVDKCAELLHRSPRLSYVVSGPFPANWFVHEMSLFADSMRANGSVYGSETGVRIRPVVSWRRNG